MLLSEDRSTSLIWTSWAQFAFCNIRATSWSSTEAIDFITSQIEHDGSVFGLPSFPEILTLPNNPLFAGIHLDARFKLPLASIFLQSYMERVKAEAWEKLERRIKEEGAGVLQSIFNETFFE